MVCEASEQTAIRLRADHVDEEGRGFLARHGSLDSPSGTGVDRLGGLRRAGGATNRHRCSPCRCRSSRGRASVVERDRASGRAAYEPESIFRGAGEVGRSLRSAMSRRGNADLPNDFCRTRAIKSGHTMAQTESASRPGSIERASQTAECPSNTHSGAQPPNSGTKIPDGPGTRRRGGADSTADLGSALRPLAQ
jgi:hypothetical protein